MLDLLQRVEGVLLVAGGHAQEDLEACAQGGGVTALYTLHDGEWVTYILGAPGFVNEPFGELFGEGVPARTPLVVFSGTLVPEEPPAAEEIPVTDEDAVAEDAPSAEETPGTEDATAAEIHGVIAYTGGLGVWRRDDCRREARIEGAEGWLEGTAVTVLERGAGRCAGWLRARADGVVSWVDGRYLAEWTGPPPALAASRGVIAHTDGLGVAHRFACHDDARVAGTAGWPEGTIVTLLQTGVGECAGWLRARTDDATSWVRDGYVTLLPDEPQTTGETAVAGAYAVIANTGGLGVWRRDDCRREARIEGAKGWLGAPPSPWSSEARDAAPAGCGRALTVSSPGWTANTSWKGRDRRRRCPQPAV